METQKNCFFSTIKEPTNIMSKEPNMPTRTQAKEAYTTPATGQGHKKASTQMTRESGEIPNAHLPGSIPIHLDWGYLPGDEGPHTSASRANQ